MESEIQTSRSTIGQLQDQLSEGRRQSVDEARVLREETENLATQVSAGLWLVTGSRNTTCVVPSSNLIFHFPPKSRVQNVLAILMLLMSSLASLLASICAISSTVSWEWQVLPPHHNYRTFHTLTSLFSLSVSWLPVLFHVT